MSSPVPSGTLDCPTNGPFGPTVNTPLTRSGNLSAFDAGANPFEAPYRAYSPGYVQQFNLDVQRQLPLGCFVDAAYAGSRGVHLSSSNNVSINNIPDSFYAQAEQQTLAGHASHNYHAYSEPIHGNCDCKRVKSRQRTLRFSRVSWTVPTPSIAACPLSGMAVVAATITRSN